MKFWNVCQSIQNSDWWVNNLYWAVHVTSERPIFRGSLLTAPKILKKEGLGAQIVCIYAINIAPVMLGQNRWCCWMETDSLCTLLDYDYKQAYGETMIINRYDYNARMFSYLWNRRGRVFKRFSQINWLVENFSKKTHPIDTGYNKVDTLLSKIQVIVIYLKYTLKTFQLKSVYEEYWLIAKSHLITLSH